MPEKALDTEDLPLPKKNRNTCGCTVWMDFGTMKDLDLISAYEHMTRGSLMRTVLVDKIRCYKRNPAFKRFLVDLKRSQGGKE